MPGLIHIYCGDGKGKTTAGVGLAVRCAGGGGKVLFASFLKDDKSGERNILDNIENIELIKNPEKTGFYKFMDENEKENCQKICRDTFEFIMKRIFENRYDLLILDEPVSGVDAAGLDMFYKKITTIRDQYHIAIILVSHDLNLIQRYADSAVLIDKTVVAQGDVDEVFASDAFNQLFGYLREEK